LMILGVGAKIWWEPPRNAMTDDLRRLVKKLCTRGKDIILGACSTLGPIGGLGVRQFNGCLPHREERILGA